LTDKIDSLQKQLQQKEAQASEYHSKLDQQIQKALELARQLKEKQNEAENATRLLDQSESDVEDLK